MAGHEQKEPRDEVLLKNESPEFIKEGYLHVSINEERKVMGKGLSDTSLLSSWSRRWAVLSQLLGGTQILLYKDHSSFLNCEAPCNVVALSNCLRLATLPDHHKSDNAFMILLEKKSVYFYTDKCSEQEGWMKTLQRILHMPDSSCHSPLKGLPRQKALRKGDASPTNEEAKSTWESPLVLLEQHRDPGILHKASQFLAWGSYHSQPCLNSTSHLPSTSKDKTTPTNNSSVKFLSQKTLNTS